MDLNRDCDPQCHWQAGMIVPGSVARVEWYSVWQSDESFGWMTRSMISQTSEECQWKMPYYWCDCLRNESDVTSWQCDWLICDRPLVRVVPRHSPVPTNKETTVSTRATYHRQRSIDAWKHA